MKQLPIISAAIVLLMLILAGMAPPAKSQQVRESRSGRTATYDPFALAVRYENGEEVAQDYRRALALYCQAARSGDTRAYFNLGWMYFNGRGVPRNDRVAEYWLQRAASKGVVQAQNLLQLLAGVRPGTAECPRDVALPLNLALARLPPHPSVPLAAIRAAIGKVADSANLNERLLIAVVAIESGFEPEVVSPKGAMGLMQLMLGTAARFGVQDPFDYRENLRGGAAYLNWLLTRFNGNLSLALAAYNAGEDAVTKYGGVPPFAETRAYVEEVQQLCGCGAATSRAQH